MVEDEATIEQAQLHADLQTQIEQYIRRTRHLEALGTVGQVISSSLALNEVLDRALDVTLAVMEMEAGEIWLFDQSTREMALVRQRGANGELFGERTRFALGEGIPGRVAKTGEVIIISDLAADLRFLRRKVVAAGFTTFAAFPLLAKGEVIGCLDIATRRACSFSEEDVQLLMAIGAAVGMAVANAGLYEDLRLATKQLEAQLDELQRTQAHLVATERLRAMGELAAGVAHDFNNALTGILGQTQLMQLALTQDTPSKERLSLHLSRQERVILDAAETTRKIRDVVRPRGGESFSTVALNEVVMEVVEVTRPRWQEEAQVHGRSIALDTDLGAIPLISGRAEELREALTNLLFNAIDALPHGGIITVTTRPVDSDGGRESVDLIVRDTGIGMSEAVRDRVFEPFFTTKGIQGTGLGLSMVYGIVSRHGGTIDVASAPGQGTTVTVRLPAAQEAVPPASPPVGRARPLHSLRVLVIDDILLIAETLADILHLIGHEVAIATGGKEGLARLEAGGFDVVITDLGMPGMSGWDVAAAVKARWPGLPVILVTGWAEEAGEERPAGAVVDLMLAKPFTTEQLSRALAQICAHDNPGDGSR